MSTAPPPGPRRNRVTPTGELVATPARGAWTGNRGRLHEGGVAEPVRFHAGNLWIICALRFRDWHAEQWRPGHFTWLYFQDEAVALAAGHRPCALCRRPAYDEYRAAWAAERGGALPSAAEVNRQLHGERIVAGTHRRRLHRLDWASLPDGAFAALDDGPALVLGDRLVGWAPTGYGAPRPRPRSGHVDVLTPPSSLAALRAGYPVQVDESARA